MKLTSIPSFGQRVVQLVVGAAVERRRRHDVAPALRQVGERHELRGLAARGGQRADPAFERGHAVLERGLGGVHDPGVDVAELLEPEQRRRVVRCRGTRSWWSGRSGRPARPSSGRVTSPRAPAWSRIPSSRTCRVLLGFGPHRGPADGTTTFPTDQPGFRSPALPTETGGGLLGRFAAWRRSRNSSPTATSSRCGSARAVWVTSTAPATACSSVRWRSRCRRPPSPRLRRNGSSARPGPRRA